MLDHVPWASEQIHECQRSSISLTTAISFQILVKVVKLIYIIQSVLIQDTLVLSSTIKVLSHRRA